MNLILRVHAYASSLVRRSRAVTSALTLTGNITSNLVQLVKTQTSSLSILTSNNRDTQDLVFNVNLPTAYDFAAADFAAADFFTA